MQQLHTSVQNELTYKHLSTQQYIIIKITNLVFTIKCTEWQFTAQQESGQRPSSDCHRVCLRLESGAGNDTPPFGTSLRPEEGICLMSAIPDSRAGAQTHSRPKWRHLTDPRCANMMRVNKVGVGLHDRNHMENTYRFNDYTYFQ